MSGPNVLHTRASILQWANATLNASHASLSDVPAADVALLLYGILHEGANTDTVRSGAPTTTASLLSLQEIQFVSQPTPAVQRSNAQHVLAMIRRVSAAGASLCDSDGRAAGGPLSPLPLSQHVVSASFTATDWLNGKCPVEELRMWRWLRAVAVARCCTVDTIHANIAHYLRMGSGGSGGSRPMSPAPTPLQTLAVGEAPSSSVESTTPVSVQLNCGTSEEAAREGVLAVDEITVSDGRKRTRVEENHRDVVLPVVAAAPPQACAFSSSTPTTSVDHAKAAVPLIHDLHTARDGFMENRVTECAMCPTVFAMALQGNMALLEELEATRKRAIAACVKKDMTELLRTLSSFS